MVHCPIEVCGFTGICFLLWYVPVLFSLYQYSSGLSVTNYFTEHSEQ